MCASLLGPLPELGCYLGELLRKHLTTQFFLFLNAITITRYVYIFCLKNPAAFKDDFWYALINTWVVLFSCLFEFTRTVLPGRQGIGFYACTGQDPTKDMKLRVRFSGVVEISSILIHAFVYTKISILKVCCLKTTRRTFKNNVTLQGVGGSSIGLGFLNLKSQLAQAICLSFCMQ